ncbi:MAG: polyribonucleotide nucleotidyltransferase [Candidatus Zambryskibacteria bacterium]|nr:polyribonucleotide nucleotidyltransferase [Candidatus Zambryskibacteria bacterium]
MKSKKFEVPFNGEKLIAEFSDLTENAHGSVLLTLGDTTVLVTVVMSEDEKDADYFPLTVEYEERFYAAGQILGSRFVRREGRPSDEAILSGRIVDRTIRPLFNQKMRNEVQVVVTVLSLGTYDPDVLGVIGASLALGVSHIPWSGPVSAVRIGKIKNSDEFVVNPSYEIRNSADFEIDTLACGKDDLINMIEIGSNEASEEMLVKTLEKAREEIVKVQNFQAKIIKEIGKEKIKIEEKGIPADLEKAFNKEVIANLGDIIGEPGKAKIYELHKKWFSYLEKNLLEANRKLAGQLFNEAIDNFVHKISLEQNKRIDGRDFDEVRKLYAKAGGVSPILHGTGIFYRGGTHIFSALTLGGPNDSQMIDDMETKTDKRFMHHYNFPPFSVGETGRIGGTNRRMIGHGNLAEKALLPVIPSKEDFPYTIRLVSETLSSNGSSSMGSVCASTLALMDGGVPIRKPVAGIASGVMLSSNGQYKILTDIQGPEDEHGDMDFKVAGTRDGVTAVQMDVKVNGIPINILAEAFEKAKKARLEILDVINKEIKEPRAEISPRAPKIVMIKIRPDQIGQVIGSGGKVINEIKDDTGTEIDVEDDGTVYITGETVSTEKARAAIEQIVKEFKAGEKAIGEVVRVADFGAIVKLGPKIDGLVHISEIAPFRIDKTENYLKVGMKVPVVVKSVDAMGKIKLSIKDADPNFVKKGK